MGQICYNSLSRQLFTGEIGKIKLPIDRGIVLSTLEHIIEGTRYAKPFSVTNNGGSALVSLLKSGLFREKECQTPYGGSTKSSLLKTLKPIPAIRTLLLHVTEPLHTRNRPRSETASITAIASWAVTTIKKAQETALLPITGLRVLPDPLGYCVTA